MTERILHLMQCEGLTPSEFASRLDIDRTNISHFISGRNLPSRSFIEKVLQAFPKLNARWLILGDGEPYSTEETPSLFETQTTQEISANVTSVNTPVKSKTIHSYSKPNKIDEIIVFHSNGTFGRYVEKNQDN